MSKNTKRLVGIVIAAVLIVALGIAGFVMASTPEEELHCYLHGDINGDGTVDKDDAIYLLYASFPGFAQDFPMQQDGKIDDNDVVNKDDAIYLLYATTDGMVGYDLKGEVHTYFDPTWTWDEDAGTATVTLKCACGSTETGSAAFTRTVDKNATCVDAGSATLSVNVTIEDVGSYTATQTEIIPATGEHAITISCTADAKCENCDYEIKASGHNWVKVETATVEATCTAEGQERYRCSGCQETDTVVLAKLEHDLTYVENGDAATGNKCEFVKRYSCASCGGVFNGTAAEDTYKKHTYVTTLTQEVTCRQAGKKTTACSECGDVQSEEILPLDITKHVWDDGVPADGKITFTCEEGCGEAKVEVVAAQDGSVDTSALSAGTGVNLGDKTSMTMDQAALDALGTQNVKISVDKKDKDEIENLSDEKKEQIGDNTVYDFTMTDGDNNLITEFSGDVTISLPYTRDEGEDINSIDIWYISDSGEATQVNGTYSNGFVTFTTRHFSYYTVTRLTPAERCARLGEHIEVTQTKAATCTEEGYNMTVCQRCGEVRSKTITPKLGHKYNIVTQDATCTEGGQITETCKVDGCSYSVTRKITALGHNMVKNTERSSEASCSAAGENVMVCDRKDCGYETVTPVAQLTHKYVKSDEKSATATCTAGGYEIHVCGLCGDEIKKNETAPLGHNYSAAKAQWTWTENMTASVKLVCANDENHTRNQDAVVTQNTDKSQNASCLGTGAAVYEAVASYNNQSYTDTKEITVAAPGHQPGTAWESTDSQHYHLCAVCGEKVGLQGHNWNQGQVTKEPTCVDAGARTVSCTVCGFSQEQTIAATGEHTYVNGRCSVCSFQESGCSHKITRSSQVDPLTVGICSGNVITKFSCECGENVRYNIKEQGCSFGQTTNSSEKDKYGNTNTKMSAACTKCGLVLEDSYTYRVDEAACYRDTLYRRQLSLNGVIVAFMEEAYNGSYHPTVTVTQTVDLADKGTCGGTLTYKTCPCGQVTNGSLLVRCNLDYVFDKDTMTYYDICIDCGLKSVSTERETLDKEHCLSVSDALYTLYKGQEQIGSFTAKRVYSAHANEVVSSELLGDSCTDGMIVNLRCTTCGTTEERFHTTHALYDIQKIDLSSYNYCIESIETETCLCDEAYSYFYINNKEGKSCYFTDVSDKETGESYLVCMECGIRRYTNTTVGEKDADCWCLATETVTYKNAEGATLVTVVERSQSPDHNMNSEVKLEEGATNCEDGIILREYCVDCGYEYTNPLNWHYTVEKTSYDMSAFGSCQTRLTLESCACGQQDDVTYQGMPCDWRRISTEENTYTDQCIRCGLVHTVTEARQQSDHPCVNRVLRVDEYTKEGVEQTVRFSRELRSESHLYTYQLSLLSGAADCSGGYRAVGTCDRCQHVQEQGGSHYHSTYPISRVRVDNGKMCGEVYQAQYSCACGQNTSTELEWSGDGECSFSGGSHNETLNAWVYTCNGCGSFYSSKMTSEKVEGTTCTYRYNQITSYYDKDGNFLVDYTYSYNNPQHSNKVTFTMLGDSCSDGYYITRICSLCGNVENDDDLYTECQRWSLGNEELHDGEGICGPITLSRSGCACGAISSVSTGVSCRLEPSYYDSTVDHHIYKCGTCGLERFQEETSVTRPDTCVADVNLKATYRLGGEVILLVDEDYVQASHMWRYSYTNTPDSCDNGYGYSYSCFRCGTFGGSNDYTTEHSTNEVRYTDLSTYGMSGYLVQRSCACGESKSWNFIQSSCDWEQVGGEGNKRTYYCKDCDTYSIRTQTRVEDTENCRVDITEAVAFVRNEQTLFTTTVYSSNEEHDEQQISAVLVNPEGSCEDGVRYTYACKNCGYTYNGSSNYHSMTETDVVETACGTKIYQSACLCGQRKDVGRNDLCNYSGEYKETGDDNNGSSSYTFTCEDCGLRYTEEQSWVRDSSTCMATYTGTATVEYGTISKTFVINDTSERHSWGEPVYSLKPGSTTCLDGLNYTENCVDCDAVYTSTHHGSHMVNVIRSTDLADKGAVCGATLQYLECPCGGEKKYDIGSDSKCKLQEQETELWIEDAIVDTYQNGVEGQRWFDSTAYTFTCAVTEPACGLKLRMAEYWLVDDKCIATEYQTWQYLDSADNTWKTLASVETGLVRAFHDYEKSYNNDTGADGSTTYSELDTCACGSSYLYEHITNADKTYAYKYTVTNTTAAERYKAMYQEIRYGFICNGRALLTYSHTDYTYHDGTTSWTEYNYTYNLEESCGRTGIKTSSDGSIDESYQKHLDNIYNVQWTREPSCTQSGVGNWTYTCIGCGVVTSSGVRNENPNNHNWSSTPTGTYQCINCGLESTNGASAGIVLEDMTDSHGNNTNYVVGYWNQDGIDFAVSVTLEREGEEPVYLQGIQFNLLSDGNGGIVAVSFSMEQTHAAAEAAAPGETYTLKVNFTNRAENLEYSITLDPVE